MEQLFLPLILGAFLLMFLFTMRRQKRVVQEQQKLQDALAPGDRVMTTSGLYATVVDTSDTTVITLEVAPGVHTEWLRQAIREKIVPADETADVESVENDSTETVIAKDTKN